MAAPPSVTQALAGCFLLLLLVQLVVHESTLAAHVSSGPELLSRRTFGVGRVLPLEHSIAAFLRSVEDRTRAARAGGGPDGRRPLDLLAREAVELGRRAALRGWSPDGAAGRGGLDVWDRGVYTSPPPRGPLPPIVEAFRQGHVDWHDLIPQHASLWERYGESRDDKFRFLTLVMKEEKVTDYLTRWDESGLRAVYGVDHGPLTNYTSCNTFDDACAVHAADSCGRDSFCRWADGACGRLDDRDAKSLAKLEAKYAARGEAVPAKKRSDRRRRGLEPCGGDRPIPQQLVKRPGKGGDARKTVNDSACALFVHESAFVKPVAARVSTAGLGWSGQTLELGHVDVDSADVWTHRSLSSSSRSAAEELASKPSHTLASKSGRRCDIHTGPSRTTRARCSTTGGATSRASTRPRGAAPTAPSTGGATTSSPARRTRSSSTTSGS